MQKLTTGHNTEIKELWDTQPWMEQLYHTSSWQDHQAHEFTAAVAAQ